jgi:hypothetical protein
VPYKRDPKVVDRLKKAKMIQDPAPLSGRMDEIKRLAEEYDLPT